ncbi:O-antigen polymerase, partial [Chryseosolibacter indicus]
ALISLLSISIGFNLNNQSGKVVEVFNFSDYLLSYYGRMLFFIGFGAFTISTKGNVGKLLNPLDAADGVEKITGGFANYLNLALNIIIPGIALLFGYYVRTKKGKWWFLITFTLAFCLFVTLGFRYRIVLLVGSLAIIYYLLKQKRPNLIWSTICVFFFISFMGIMNLSRSYNRGLDLTKLQGKDTRGYYESGLQEAKIFQTSGAVLTLVPDKHPYVGLRPVIATLLFPIPSAIYTEKNSADYLFSVLDTIYSKKYSKGAAFLMYAEHFLALGWFGVVIGGFAIGWFFRKLWNWYLINRFNPLITVAYAITVIYLYVIISRGYLPQVTMLFFFTVFPIYLVINAIKRKFRNHSLKKIYYRGA